MLKGKSSLLLNFSVKLRGHVHFTMYIIIILLSLFIILLVKAHDDHFSKLIADVRERELKRRLSSTPSSVATSGNPSPPMALEPLVPVALEPLVPVAQGAGVATHENQEEDDDDDCVLSYSPVIPAACERGRSSSSSSSGGDRDKVRGDGGGWGVDGDLQEDSQLVFAPDSPTFSPPSSPLLLGKGTDRRVLRKTLSIPERYTIIKISRYMVCTCTVICLFHSHNVCVIKKFRSFHIVPIYYCISIDNSFSCKNNLSTYV